MSEIDTTEENDVDGAVRAAADTLNDAEVKRGGFREAVENTAQGAYDNVKSAVTDAVNNTELTTTSELKSIENDIKGGIKNFGAEVDRLQEKIEGTTVQGLVTDGVESVKNMAAQAVTDTVANTITSTLGGGGIDIVYSDPDSYGMVYPVSASLGANGNDTLSGIIKILTGLGQNGILGTITNSVVDAGTKAIYKEINSLDKKVSSYKDASELHSELQSEANDLVSQINSIQNPQQLPQSYNIFLGDSDGNGGRLVAGTQNPWQYADEGPDEIKQGYIDQTNADAVTDVQNVLSQENAGLEVDREGLAKDLGEVSGLDGKTVLDAIESEEEVQAKLVKQADEYESYIKRVVNNNPDMGVLSSLSQNTLTRVVQDIRKIAPEIPLDQINNIIFNSQGDVAQQSLAYQTLARYSNSDFDTIKTTVDNIDTTITGNTTAGSGASVFSAPLSIDGNVDAYQSDREDIKFSFVSSVEELRAEFKAVSREITEMIVHWSETNTNRDIGASELHRLHLKLRLKGIGYHYIIRRDGSLQRGRPLNLTGQHAPTNGHDEYSIGVCFIGGINAPTDTDNHENFLSAQSLTRAQMNTFDHLCRQFYVAFPGGSVMGHSDVDADEIDPGFDVIDYCEARFNRGVALDNPSENGPLTIEDILNDK